ncbi:acidic ribosomal protein P1 (nucleomorph) [Guillardia theta]|uniref:Acidic ribosomal protein P1 n=1 Tax=Guillardia theta TaxID=55529 RepID=Q98SB2_GUITH|nr:acidic ribosomal protein P1 [Guillardia theta]AAK39671.1 acidic ribosomal protein P1 [Guillardia theta]
MWGDGNVSVISCILSILILKENKIKITKDLISLVLKTSNNNVEDYFLSYFERISASLDEKESDSVKKNENTNVNIENNNKIENKKIVEKEKEESDMDLGIGLFD